ncbi:hypothetical protein BSL82_03390 [Tardibacter chloracetimidivorans]|uniref:Uncharacterized protein n=1 Tax=Tardibacter chloracetimidivorans TaxID=1921510 RepID=A0A1L3ZS47_9SPHN|nr:hypothetical protein BSL82_03390 [Tardibacter chloracetimidivorans]
MHEKSIGKTGRKTGVPSGWNYKEYAVEVAEAEKQARKMFNIMADEGLVPDDQMAQAALLEALTIMKNKATSTAHKLSASRLVLDYTRAKPASKSDVTIHKAESLLEALAAQEADGPEDS